MKKRKEHLYNDYDQDQVQEILKQRKAKKRKKIMRKLLVLLVLGLIVAFFVSDYSKVRSITISGNFLVSEDVIYESLSITEHRDFFFLVRSKNLKEKVEEIPLISSAEVSKDLFGHIEIKVTECEPLGYAKINNQTFVIDETGRVAKYEGENESYLQRGVLIKKMEESMLEEFGKEYAKIPTHVRNQVSDITYAPLNQDETRVEFYMDDGKVLILRIEDMADQLAGNNYNLLIEKYPKYKTYDFQGKNCYIK